MNKHKKKIAFQNADRNANYFQVRHLKKSKLLTKSCGFALKVGCSWRYQSPIEYSNNGNFIDKVTIEFIPMLYFVDLTLQLSLNERNSTRNISSMTFLLGI